MESAPSQTKNCPFCAETIQAAAVKCRFCGEFINTDRAAALDSQSDEDEEMLDEVLFAGRPSFFGMLAAVIRGLFLLGVAGFLITYPVENLLVFQSDGDSISAEYEELIEELPEPELAWSIIEEAPKFSLTAEQAVVFARYRKIAGTGLAVLVVFILLLKMVRLKMIYYEVTAERIEWSRGILDRRVDNLDMFRIIDLKMRRSLLDCIFGIGTVGLITTDKTDPKFTFKKVRNPRLLYDIIKEASLEADRRSGTIHIE